MASVRLRTASTGDLDAILSWVNDPEVTGRFARLGHVTREDERAYLERLARSERDRLYVIEDEQGLPIGTAGLHDIAHGTARIGIIIGHKDCWGRGYGTAALNALIGEARRYGIARVWGVARTDNARMRHLLAKTGFLEDSSLPAAYCLGAACYDMVHATKEIAEGAA